MESRRESSSSSSEEELGEEEKMERFFELIRHMREARVRMARLRGIPAGESEVATARQTKRRKADGGSSQEGGGMPWMPRFEAEDFGEDGRGCGGSGCSVQGTSGNGDGGEETGDDDGCGLSLKLTL